MFEYTKLAGWRFRAPIAGDNAMAVGTPLPTGRLSQGEPARTPLDN